MPSQISIINITTGISGDPSYGSFRAADFLDCYAQTYKDTNGGSDFYAVVIELSNGNSPRFNHYNRTVQTSGGGTIVDVYYFSSYPFSGVKVSSLTEARSIVSNINLQMLDYLAQ